MAEVTAIDNRWEPYRFSVTFEKENDLSGFNSRPGKYVYTGKVTIFTEGIEIFSDHGIMADNADDALALLRSNFAHRLARALSPGGLIA